MKLLESSKSVINAKLWPIIEVISPWGRSNWKYIAVSLFGWFIFVAIHFNSENNNKNVQKQARERDVSTSIVSMEPLLRLEQKLVQSLNEYANQLQRKVDTIRRGIGTMRKPPFIYDINEEEFLSNPFNSFPMLRRLKHEWKAWEKYLKVPEKTEYIDAIHRTLREVEDFDLTDSVQGVQRLREIYDIQPSDWTGGKLHYGEHEIRFTSLDCYAVAFILHKQEDYEAADEWFEASLNSYVLKGIYKYLGFNLSVIYETYVDNLIKENRTALALMLTDTALKRDPGNPKLMKKKLIIESLNVTAIPSKAVKDISDFEGSIMRGCRGEYVLNTTSELSCYYNWSVNDFVRLAPFKVEEILDDPQLLLYHDIMSDDEIHTLKSVAKDKLTRSTVSASNGSSVVSPVRTSKHTWIRDNWNHFTEMLNRRFEDMTGLNPRGTSLFVGNYGLGGHYVAHTDCNVDCEHSVNDKSNCDGRLMTVLIYLTDVESGGATIFPSLEVAAVPQKGTALVWYNLENTMKDCDQRTLHMACPVLFGSKWFSMKWINFKNQMFRKPCFVQNANSVS